MSRDKVSDKDKLSKEYARPISMWGLAWQRFKKNKVALAGLFIVGYIVFMALFADFIAPYGPNEAIISEAKQAPSWIHPFGTDEIGTDIFSLIVYGARGVLFIGFGAAGLAIGIAILVGIAAGYYGGVVDEVLMRLTEVFLVMPFLLVILVLMRIFLTISPQGFGGLGMMVIIIGVFSWAGNARLIRGEVLRVREFEFIQAAKCLGAGGKRILFRHILPNVLYLVIILTTLAVAGAVLVEAGISFLGFGDPNSTTWGQILYRAFENVFQGLWWTYVFPGIFVSLLVMGFNLLGNGLRDALDPRLRE